MKQLGDNLSHFVIKEDCIKYILLCLLYYETQLFHVEYETLYNSVTYLHTESDKERGLTHVTLHILWSCSYNLTHANIKQDCS